MIKKAVYIEPAPAKINLYLEVFPKANPEDTHHPISTLFQAIDLMDFITFEILMECSEPGAVDEVDFSISIDSNSDEVKELSVNNSVVKAIEQFFACLPAEVLDTITKVDISLYIDKHIPMSAGLAGGSSDAAAALRVLNKFLAENFNCKVADEDLEHIALSLGSDIPFCLRALEEPRLYAEGRGEKFSKNELLDTKILEQYKEVILIKPEFGVATAEAYASLSKELKTDDTNNEIFFNRFEQVVFNKHPALKIIKDRLLVLGCDRAMLSGSGSTMIGFVANDNEIDPIYQDAINNFPNMQVFKAKFLAKVDHLQGNI